MSKPGDFSRLYDIARATDDARDIPRVLEEAYKAGDKAAPLVMVMMANLIYGKQVPQWAFQAIKKACVAARTGQITSWDEVFGKPVPNGKQARSLRTENQAEWVWARVLKLKDEGETIDDRLFERVGRELGVGGKTTAKRLYSKVEARARKQRGGKYKPLTQWVIKDGVPTPLPNAKFNRK